MRKIKFKEPQVAKWKKWRKKCDKETMDLVDNWSPGTSMKMKPSLYKKMKPDIYFNENGPFKNKCAYCESELRLHDDLDHFRPKLRVTDEEDNVIKIKVAGKKIEHPGYFWLAYWWKNLIPTCKTCNSASTQNDIPIGKRNRFPVRGIHAIKIGEEKKEKPLLVNPISDFPEKHFAWDRDQSIIVSKSEKGRMTIKILGFHQRGQLRQNWAKTYDDIYREIMGLLSPEIDNTHREQKIIELKRNIEEGNILFSFVAMAAFEDVRKLFL